MKNSILAGIVSIILISCSAPEKEEIKEDRIIGLWKTDSINISFIHGNFKIPKKDLKEVNSTFINPDFILEFKRNYTYQIKNLDGSIDSGVYILSNNSIKLKKDNSYWLNLEISELTSTTMDFIAKTIRFYAPEKDSIHFFTGDKVKIKLKKTSENKS